MSYLNGTKTYVYFDETEATHAKKQWAIELVQRRLEQQLQTITLKPDGRLFGLVRDDGLLRGDNVWYELDNALIHPYGWQNPDSDVDYLAPAISILICTPGSDLESIYLDRIARGDKLSFKTI